MRYWRNQRDTCQNDAALDTAMDGVHRFVEHLEVSLLNDCEAGGDERFGAVSVFVKAQNPQGLFHLALT